MFNKGKQSKIRFQYVMGSTWKWFAKTQTNFFCFPTIHSKSWCLHFLIILQLIIIIKTVIRHLPLIHILKHCPHIECNHMNTLLSCKAKEFLILTFILPYICMDRTYKLSSFADLRNYLEKGSKTNEQAS